MKDFASKAILALSVTVTKSKFKNKFHLPTKIPDINFFMPTHFASRFQDENMNAPKLEKECDKAESKKSFVIDSESDFPSLATCSKSSQPPGVGVQDSQSYENSAASLKEFRVNGAPVVFKLLKKEKKKRKGGPTVNEKVV